MLPPLEVERILDELEPDHRAALLAVSLDPAEAAATVVAIGMGGDFDDEHVIGFIRAYARELRRGLA